MPLSACFKFNLINNSLNWSLFSARSIDLYCSLVKETIDNAKKNIPEASKQNGEQKVISPKSSSSPLKKKIN